LRVMKNPVSLLRYVALAEGVSFLVLLLIAMPLKYVAARPAAVTYVGWAHGVLFVTLCAALVLATLAARWPLGRAAVVFVAALLPAGPFVLDRRMKAYERAYAARS
jgi:integral membrane protein